VLLGACLGLVGIVWYGVSPSALPLLLIPFSVYFLVQFFVFFVRSNGITITPSRIICHRSFPRLRTQRIRWRRTPSLGLRFSPRFPSRRFRIWRVELREGGKPPTTLTVRLTATQRIELEQEFKQTTRPD
jgi:hypothetical protein